MGRLLQKHSNFVLIPLDSAEEREVVLKALRQCGHSYSRYYLNEALEDVRFDFQLRDDIVIGSPFRLFFLLFLIFLYKIKQILYNWLRAVLS